MTLPEVIVKIRDDWGKDPYNINNGECEDFARAVAAQAVLDKVDCLIDWRSTEYYRNNESLPGHIWLYDRFTKLHHDAECPQGVRNWRRLPIFKGEK